MGTIAPQLATHDSVPGSAPLAGGVDRLIGYGVMGLPFASGDYLALRCWPDVSFGSGYRSVWHRSPTGRWTIYADAAPEVSCARFMGRAADEIRTEPVTVRWPTAHRLEVAVGADVEWAIDLAPTRETRALSAVASATPAWAWQSSLPLRLMAAAAGAVLRTGRLQFAGTTPNGQLFAVAPRQVWAVTASTARVHGRDLGSPRPLPTQPRLGDVRLPQRGVFFAATTATFRRAATPATVGGAPDPASRHTTRSATR